MMIRVFGSGFLRYAVAAAALWSGAASAQALEAVSVRLDWLAGAYHAPLFVAKERGFFEAQGLDVELGNGQGSISTLQVIGGGNGDIGLANLSALAMASSRGVPVIAIAGVMQRAPEAVISLESSGIRTPKDLEGKRWGAVAGDEAQRLFTAFAAVNGVDTSKIRKINLNHSAAITSLLNGDVDFVCAWALQDGLKIAQVKPIGQPMLFADSGLNTLGTSIFVTRATLERRGDMLRRFMIAVRQGAEAVAQDPNAGVEAIMRARPESMREVLTAEIAAVPQYLHTKNSEGKPFGWLAEADILEMLTVMRTYYDLPESVTPVSIYDGQFAE